MSFLFGGSDSESNTTSTNSTTNQDNRVAVTDSGINAAVSGGGSLTINSSDRVIAGQALDSVMHTSDVVGSVANTAVNTTGAISAGAIAANTDVVNRAGATLASTLGQAQGNFLTAVNSMAAHYADVADQANQRADAFARRTLDQGFQYGADSQRAAYGFAGDSQRAAYGFAGDVQTRANNTTQDALASVRQTTSTLTSFIDRMNQTPDSRAFNSTLPWLVSGAVVIAIFAFRKG